MTGISLFILTTLMFLPWVAAWDSEQLEVFDLVEEVNQNFYELLDVAENAETSEIRKAYRKLSLQLHPDKNSAPDAEVRFRQLVAIYEILKSEDRRRLYDSVLRDGLPDWRQPVYYYRKARKLGLVELFVILFVIFTVGHYLVIWAMYLERKFELEEILFSQVKRKHEKGMRKKREKGQADLDKVAEGVSEIVTDMLEAPTWHRLLPVQLGLALKDFLMNTPHHYQTLREFVAEFLISLRRKEKEESDDEGEEMEQETRKRPKRKRIELPEYREPENVSEFPKTHPMEEKPNDAVHLPSRANLPWNEAELSKLAKAMARFPSGTLNRWEKVAEFMERTVGEITSKNKELREARYNHLNQMASPDTPEERVKKNKKSAQAMASLPSDLTLRDVDVTDATEVSASATVIANTSEVCWSQNQQKILEWALTQYPKGTPERWDKIAEHIPGKSKTDCMQRFKFIVETIKQKQKDGS